MLLQLQNYDLKVDYIPGKQIPVADSLLHNFVDDTFPGFWKDWIAQVHPAFLLVIDKSWQNQKLINNSSCLNTPYLMFGLNALETAPVRL